MSTSLVGEALGSGASTLGHIVLVGAGNMGGAMLQRWPEGTRITVIDPAPSEAMAGHMRVRGARHAVDARNVDAADILVLAVKPQLMSAVLPDLRPLVGPGTLVLSVAAGITIAALSDALGTDRIVRTIPNTPAMIGQGVTAVFAAPPVGDNARRAAQTLLEASGSVVWMEEEADIDRATALSGSGPAYLFHLVEALARAGHDLGLEGKTANALARQTVIGAAALLAASEDTPATLRERVTSKGGTTAAALAVLMDENGLGELMTKAARAAHQRAVALSREEDE